MFRFYLFHHFEQVLSEHLLFGCYVLCASGTLNRWRLQDVFHK